MGRGAIEYYDEKVQRVLRRKCEKEEALPVSCVKRTSKTYLQLAFSFTFSFCQNSSMICSCVDCPIACPFTKLDLKLNDLKLNTFMIGEFNGYGVIAAILVILITILIGGICMLFKNRRKKGMEQSGKSIHN